MEKCQDGLKGSCSKSILYLRIVCVFWCFVETAITDVQSLCRRFQTLSFFCLGPRNIYFGPQACPEYALPWARATLELDPGFTSSGEYSMEPIAFMVCVVSMQGPECQDRIMLTHMTPCRRAHSIIEPLLAYGR